jgi:tetratricopeptide (TPR) repeat protein
MAQAQTVLGRNDEAKETLRSWAKADEDNPTPPSALAEMLLQEGDGAGAVDAMNAAIARLPEDKKKDERLQLMLGRAQLKAGMKDKGHDTLLALMKTTESPEMMNDSAYELADAGQELAAAEETTKRALEKMTDESKGWTLDENPQTLAAKSRLLPATWDTMGWILYREGKLEEAESYLKAAWRNEQVTDIGEHLAEVEAAKGDKNKALEQYELAAGTIPTVNMMGAKKEPGV